MVRGSNFDCCWHVENDFFVVSWSSLSPSLLNSFSDLDGKIHLSLRKRLRTIVELIHENETQKTTMVKVRG